MPLMDSLLHLNQVDAQVRGLRTRLDSAQRYLNAQTRLLDELRQQHEELTTRRKHVKATIGNIESEVATIDGRIEKLRDELNNSETKKQYDAFLSELSTVKERRAELEDQMLHEMEQTETLDAELTALDEQIAERQKVRDVADQQLAERTEEVGERLAELESERAQAAAAVPGDALAIFDEMSEIYDGEAMAPIDEVERRRREFACGACHLNLPYDLVSMLMGGSDTVIRCSSCSRILYLQDELRGVLAKK